jgi:drug/metabolite transporter superfamily protein YnfA
MVDGVALTLRDGVGAAVILTGMGILMGGVQRS